MSSAIKSMFLEVMQRSYKKLADNLERSIFSADRSTAWPRMSNQDWWNYYKQMTEACPQCKDPPYEGGPSPTWAHARHQYEMGYNVHD